MPKINQEEYEVLKEALNEGYEWIARDSHNPLCTHRHKPVKQDHWIQQYWGNVGNGYKEIDNRLFRFIQWEDEEPYSIAELIEEYEKDYKGSWEHAIEFSGEVFGESEETEVKKGKKWLKNEVNKLPLRFLGFSMLKQREEFTVSKDDVLDLINQLDEPEVLSQEWIDEHETHYNHWVGAVPVTELQNLLVPKQEEITESFKETVRKLIETSELAMDVRKLTGMTLEQIAEEARNGGIVPTLSEPETVADVVTTFWKSYERLKEVMNIKIEELEQ